MPSIFQILPLNANLNYEKSVELLSPWFPQGRDLDNGL